MQWWRHAQNLSIWASENLINRFDISGGHYREGKSVKRFTNKTPLTTQRIVQHFQAENTEDVIGVHCISPQNTCKWVAVDLDNHDGSPETNTQNRAKVLSWIAQAKQMNLEPLTFNMGSGSFHFYLIFKNPIPSDTAYRLVRTFQGGTDYFPKQERLTDKVPFGNWLRLPGMHPNYYSHPIIGLGDQWTHNPVYLFGYTNYLQNQPDIGPYSGPVHQDSKSTGSCIDTTIEVCVSPLGEAPGGCGGSEDLADLLDQPGNLKKAKEAVESPIVRSSYAHMAHAVGRLLKIQGLKDFEDVTPIGRRYYERLVSEGSVDSWEEFHQQWQIAWLKRDQFVPPQPFKVETAFRSAGFLDHSFLKSQSPKINEVAKTCYLLSLLNEGGLYWLSTHCDIIGSSPKSMSRYMKRFMKDGLQEMVEPHVFEMHKGQVIESKARVFKWTGPEPEIDPMILVN